MCWFNILLNPEQAIIHFCRFCERYLQPPTTWIAATLESRELLALCLKKLKGLNKVMVLQIPLES